MGKLTGVDSYLWEKLTEIPRGTIPLEEWEEKWDEENGKGEEKWRETCETPREGVVPTYTEMGGVELDLSENGMREEWKGEKGEDVGAHVCVQIKRLSHPCDCLGWFLFFIFILFLFIFYFILFLFCFVCLMFFFFFFFGIL